MKTINYPDYLKIVALISHIRPFSVAYHLVAILTNHFSPRESEMPLVAQKINASTPSLNTYTPEVCLQSYRQNIGVATLNTYFFHKMTQDWLNRRIKVTGEDHFRTAIHQKRGILVLSAHQHHLVFLGVTLGLLGLKINPILLDPDLTVPDSLSKYMDRMLKDSEHHFNGGNYILVDFQNRFIRKIYRLLAKGEVIVSANDFPNDLAPKRRIRFPFLSQSISIPYGSIKIAIEQGALITTAFIRWHGKDRFSLDIRPIEEKTVEDVCKVYVNRLQETVINDPGGWEGWKWQALFN